MTHIKQLIETDEAVDPDTGLTIRVNEKPFPTDTNDDQLAHLLDESHHSGWAIDVIDDCLFIGAYAGKMLPPSPFLFEQWVKGCGLRQGNPISNLLSSMLHPLALPLFNLSWAFRCAGAADSYVLGDGIPFRILYHGMTPRSMIESLRQQHLRSG